MNVKIKRVYEEILPGDGTRILIDRLWPRGLSKERARVDYWDKNLAPSTELRRWFNHDPSLWEEFKVRYFDELSHEEDAVRELELQMSSGPCVLLYAAHDEEHNNAVALCEYLKSRRI